MCHGIICSDVLLYFCFMKKSVDSSVIAICFIKSFPNFNPLLVLFHKYVLSNKIIIIALCHPIKTFQVKIEMRKNRWL